MAFAPGQSGNPTGGRKDKPWRDALMLALNEADGDRKRLRAVAEKCVAQALNGDMQAIKEVADRLDGKPAQQQIHTGDEDGGPVTIQHIERVIIDPANPDSPSVPAAP